MVLKEVQIVLVLFQSICRPLSGAIFLFKVNILIYRWIKFFAESLLKVYFLREEARTYFQNSASWLIFNGGRTGKEPYPTTGIFR